MEKQQVLVVGGGITGLATAYIAAKAGHQVTLLEGSDQVGGLLKTFPVGGNQLEHFYHLFFTHDQEALWLLEELEITDQLKYYYTSMGVFRNGKIHDFNRPIDLLRFSPLSWLGKAKFAFTSLFLGRWADWRNYESIPALEWFYKVAGKNVTDSLWRPLLNIKFGPFADKIPLAWMIGRMRQRLESRKQGEERLGYLNGSLETLLVALKQKLTEKGVQIHTNTRVEELLVEQGKLVGVRAGQREFRAENTVLTIPSAAIAQLVKPHHAAYAEKVEEVAYFGAVCVILELDRKLSEVYWLNVADEGFPFGGVIEHTNLIDESHYQGKHLVYLSRYFALNEELASMSEEEIKNVMIPPLKRIYPAFDTSWIQGVHVFKSHSAATVCDLNFSEKVMDAKSPIEGLYVANMVHIYPDERSTNNSIRLGAEVCRLMGIDAHFVPKGGSLSAQIGFDS